MTDDISAIAAEMRSSAKAGLMSRISPAEVLALIADWDRRGKERDHARSTLLKWMKERPVAPHPVDQVNNLTKGLLEHAEAENAALTARVAELEAKAEAYSKMIDAQQDGMRALFDERDGLLSRVAEITEALKPFANASQRFGVHWKEYEDQLNEIGLTVGDCRRARAVLGNRREKELE